MKRKIEIVRLPIYSLTTFIETSLCFKGKNAGLYNVFDEISPPLLIGY